MTISTSSPDSKNTANANRIVFGIRGRIALLIVILVVITSLSITIWIFQRFNDELISRKVDELSAETLLQSTRFRVQIEELQEDVAFLAGTPPIQGVIRARQNSGIDPTDGSTEEVWLERLGIIFSELLKAKQDYMQIRYIGMDDNGREIIRVDRLNQEGRVIIIPEELLQNKADRDYFKEAIANPPGEVSLSEINLNRDFGVVSQPPIPVLRASIPIYGDDGTLFGIFVINQDIGLVFNATVSVSDQDHVYYIANANGDYLYHPNQDKAFGFEYGESFRIQDDFPELREAFLDSEEVEKTGIFETVNGGTHVASMRKISYDISTPSQLLAIIAVDDDSTITEVSRQVLNRAYLIIAVMIILSLIIGILFSRRLTQPILEMTTAARGFATGKSNQPIPYADKTEVGVLARVFAEMQEQVTERTSRLEEEIHAREKAERLTIDKNRALERSNNELERSNNELEQFAYAASHDLQEPLRTIASYTQLLERRYSDKIDESGKEFMNFITDATGRMQSLIQALLDFSRISTRTQPFSLLNCKTIMESIQDDLAQIIKESEAEVTVDFLPTIHGDESQVWRLFQNLLGNALKYGHPDRPPKIHITAEKKDGCWEFIFEDNGIGIAPEYYEKIFIIFQRLHGWGEYSGTGIGLAICKKIVERHGGRIWLESVPGEGTKFFFTIPDNYVDTMLGDSTKTGGYYGQE